MRNRRIIVVSMGCTLSMVLCTGNIYNAHPLMSATAPEMLSVFISVFVMLLSGTLMGVSLLEWN